MEYGTYFILKVVESPLFVYGDTHDLSGISFNWDEMNIFSYCEHLLSPNFFFKKLSRVVRILCVLGGTFKRPNVVWLEKNWLTDGVAPCEIKRGGGEGWKYDEIFLLCIF